MSRWLSVVITIFLFQLGISKFLFVICSILLFIGWIAIYIINYVRNFKMDHIRSRFIEGSLINPTKCLYTLRSYILDDYSKVSDVLTSQNSDEKIQALSAHKNYIPMSGRAHIDDLLQQIFNYVVRDYIDSWYPYISPFEKFKQLTLNCLQLLTAKLCHQLKTINYIPYLTKNLVEEFVNHLKIHKYTLQVLSASAVQKLTCPVNVSNDANSTNSCDTDFNIKQSPDNTHSCDLYNDSSEFENQYFQIEAQFENFSKCHRDVCCDNQIKKSFLKTLSQMLMFILIPAEEFTRVVKDLITEILVNIIFIPTIELFSDPDYINQLIIKLCWSYPITNETFLEVIRVSECVPDLDAVKDIVIAEIARERSRDTGGIHDTEIKQRLQSLGYLQKLIESRMKRILQGTPYTEFSYKYKTLSPDQSEYLKNIQFSFVLDHALSLDYFLNYLTSINRQNYLYFYLTVESFRTLTRQHIPPEYLNNSNTATTTNLNPLLYNSLFNKSSTNIGHTNPHSQPISIKLVRNEAQKIYDQYLGERAPHSIKLNPVYVKTLKTKIRNNEIPRGDWFDDLQYQVYQLFVNKCENVNTNNNLPGSMPQNSAYPPITLGADTNDEIGLFEKFKKDDLFYKMLAELDLLPDPSAKELNFNFNGVPEKLESTPDCAYYTNDDYPKNEKSANGACIKESVMFDAEELQSDLLLESPILENLDEPEPLQHRALNGIVNRTFIKDPLSLELPSNQIMPQVNNYDRSNDSSLQSASLTHFSHLEREYKMTAHVTHIVVTRESDKTYAMYAINVTRQPLNSQSSIQSSSHSNNSNNHHTKNQANIESWFVYRRYSEFHDLQMNLRDKYNDLDDLKFPSKKPFGNMTKEFLEKRLKTLDSYLKTLMSPEFLKTHKGSKELIEQFLQPGPYEKWNGQIARKMDTFVNPFKSSVRFVGTVVKTVPENIADSVLKVSDNLKGGVGKFITLTQNIPGLKFISDTTHSNFPIHKATLSDIEDEDNITFRIIVLLMDEIFDLRTRNQWIRHRLLVILRQIFQVAYGGTLNKKLIDQIERLTSSQQVASYLKKFRDSFWPGGVWAGPYPPRSQAVKSRTRILALAKIFSAIPDEIKTLVGSETTREGVKTTFGMLQNQALNKRFLHVFAIEGFLPLLFPGGLGQRIVQILTAKYLRNFSTPHSNKNVNGKQNLTNPADISKKLKQVILNPNTRLPGSNESLGLFLDMTPTKSRRQQTSNLSLFNNPNQTCFYTNNTLTTDNSNDFTDYSAPNNPSLPFSSRNSLLTSTPDDHLSLSSINSLATTATSSTSLTNLEQANSPLALNTSRHLPCQNSSFHLITGETQSLNAF